MRKPKVEETAMATQMTRADFYAKYGDVKVTFSGYYKYTFTYEATLPDGKRLIVIYGGNADKIFQHNVATGQAEMVSRIQPHVGVVLDCGETVETFRDFE